MANVNYIIPPLVAVTDKLIPRYITGDEPADASSYRSYLGTLVYSPLEFLDTLGLNSNAKGTQTSDVLLRIDTVLHSVTETKNIVKTAIQGRAGTIKEYVGLGDFEVTLEGEIVSPFANVFPQDDVDMLLRLLKHPGQLRVASEFLMLFGITYLCIDRYSIAQKLGSRNSIPFSISASSDEDENDDLFIK